jgi:hypothetical protein
MGEAGRQRVAVEFSMKRLIDRIENLYIEVAHGRGR